ncbi:MAG: hypothetical protein UT48_C0037G0002 [Parcubacteria group bacterium GW2011_GWE2_39_37]|uniref:Uncharacterized protein n=1 Tax=Candidatus Falkowbacteria bacterium GW2011_GWF2_39_8 TaxID=1618642 RepID=A0A0G0SE39_9BACT|nr:MAG: hypothetical protein UT48_C0037G0002 [Parcubacteria group bacterium GW2011_GWE2_39_37]KKR32980.1 MAG: hypothetical protein UT64_C0017G0008 [Candidatus Falkowbacteria bacterium GW2011_GWF2_39_8]
MIKKFPKILLYLFVTIFILQILSLTFLLLLPKPSAAADIKFTPQVGIPGQKTGDDTKDFSGKSEINFSEDKTIRPIGEYIRWFYKYAIGAVGILATIVMMFGGVLWITAMGSPERITDAKAWITASLTGLFLALTSYLMLATINPALVNLNTPGILNVKDLNKPTGTPGCCEYMTGGNKAYEILSEDECKIKTGYAYYKDKKIYPWPANSQSCMSDDEISKIVQNGCCQNYETADPTKTIKNCFNSTKSRCLDPIYQVGGSTNVFTDNKTCDPTGTTKNCN